MDIYDDDYVIDETMDDGDELFDYRIPKHKSLRPYHLNSALTPYWFDDLKARRGDKRALRCLRDIEEVTEIHVETSEWSPIRFYLLFGINAMLLDPLNFEDDALEICQTINNAEQIMWQGRTEAISLILNDELSKAVKSPMYKYYNLQANMFSTIVLVMNALASERNLPTLSPNIRRITNNVLVINPNDNSSIYITESLVYGRVKGRSFVMNYDSMLMCSDLAKQRRLVMGITYLGNKLFPENYPTQSNFGELLSIIDDGLMTFGNEFYKVIKTYEPLCVGAIMKTKEDHFVDNNEFFETMFKSVLDDDPQFDGPLNMLTAFLTSERNPRWLAQYFGLYRIWGHPIVDVEAGIKKVMDIGLKETIVNEHATLEAERHFKFIFLTNYKKKHHIYPNLTVNGKHNCWLMTALLKNKDLPKPGQQWYMHDLDYIDFAETFKPPATFNLTSIIADKAISPSRSELKELIKTGRNSDPSLRRGVLKWLKMENVSCKEILKIVNNNEFKDDWCIIGVYPKEREENLKPRLFALMSFELRLYVVVTEEMLSDNILGYFPQITMTHSQLELTKSIFTATRHQSTEYSKKLSNLVTISLSMDFEKWNIKMRKSATFRVFRQLGLLFGMENLFTATHDILSRSYIYLADGSYTPDLSLEPDGKKSWTGHLGGFEGLRQKGWTIFTACLIDFVCSRRDVSFKLMGQGDNQVVQLIFRLNHTVKGSNEYDPRDVARIKKVTSSILSELEEVFSSVGMTLKISETWKSSHLFSYGKNMVFDGVPLPLSLKKGARAFYESNEGIMVVDSMLATVNTNCQAAAYQDLSHHVAYMMSRYESYIMCRKLIEYHPLLGSGLRTYESRSWTARDITFQPPLKIPPSKYIAAAMICVPRMTGGYNSTCFFEYIMRGFPDPFTRDIRYLNVLLRGLKALQIDQARMLYQVIAPWYNMIPNPTIDKSFLIQDPLAVNLIGPKSPMDAMRTAVEDILQSSHVRNQPFKKLLTLKTRKAVDTIASILWSAEKINARLGHDIYQATPYGYVSQSIARIENTNTIRNIAYNKSPRDIIEIIGEAEVNKYLFFVWKCAQSSDNVEGLLIGCTRSLADIIREQSWKKPITGVTVPFPDEYLSMEREAKKISDSDEDGYFIVGFNEHSSGNRDRLVSSLGPSPPYLGSVTREKTKQSADTTVFKAESLIRRPLNLQRAVDWFIPSESNLAELIRQTLSCVCDLDPRDFKTTDWESTGSHIHRYHDTVTKKGVLVNYSYLPGTHMYLSSDLLVKYSQSKANVNIVYQACLVYQQYLAWIIQLEHMVRGSTPVRALCWKVVCNCVQEIDEEFHDIDCVPDHILPKNEGNELLWVSKDDLIVHHSSRLKLIAASDPIDISTVSDPDLIKLFHIYMGKRVAIDIFQGEISEDTESKMVDSTNKFPRVYYGKMDLRWLASSVIIWLKVFLARRIGEIKYDITALIQMREKIRERISMANALCFQGLGLFFTNRLFCEEHLQKVDFPKPSSYPYTLRSVGLAMKEYLIGLLDKRQVLLITTKSLYPLEFNNLEEETISILYYRIMARKRMCFNCLKEVSRITNADHRTFCTEHTDLTDLFYNGQLRMKYIPATLDRLSKLAKSKGITKIARPARVCELTGIPKCRPILSSIQDTIRYGSDRDCPPTRDRELPSLGSEWQKFVRAANQPTASRYKWTCVLASVVNSLEFRNVLIFGDGLGGISDLINLMRPEANLTVASYLNVADAINHSTIGCIPPEYKGDPERIDVYYQANRINDVISPEFRLDWALKGSEFDTLVSDVELPRDTSEEVYLFYIQNLLSIRSENMIIKIYCKKFRLTVNIISEACAMYGKVDLITCSTANLHYNEMFLICRQKKRDPSLWLFSLPSFDNKIDQAFQMNNMTTWAPYKEALILERCHWIGVEVQRSHRSLCYWFARHGLDVELLECQFTQERVIQAIKQAISINRKRTYGTKRKIPYHIMMQIAQRIAALMLINANDVELLRRYLINPEYISIVIDNTPTKEQISITFSDRKCNDERWDQTLRYVATGRRVLQYPL